MISLAVYSGIIITLTLIGYFSPGYAEIPAPRQSRRSQNRRSQKKRSRCPVLLLLPKPEQMLASQAGAKLFTTAGCIACHSVLGKGGSVGPELSAATLKGRDRAWLD